MSAHIHTGSHLSFYISGRDRLILPAERWLVRAMVSAERARGKKAGTSKKEQMVL